MSDTSHWCNAIHRATVSERPSCPPSVWVIPQCPYEKSGTVSAARSQTGRPAPSPSPSSAAHSAAPPSVCLSGPLGLHTWCANG